MQQTDRTLHHKDHISWQIRARHCVMQLHSRQRESAYYDQPAKMFGETESACKHGRYVLQK